MHSIMGGLNNISIVTSTSVKPITFDSIKGYQVENTSEIEEERYLRS